MSRRGGRLYDEGLLRVLLLVRVVRLNVFIIGEQVTNITNKQSIQVYWAQSLLPAPLADDLYDGVDDGDYDACM